MENHPSTPNPIPERSPLILATAQPSTSCIISWSKYSSYLKLTRVMARILQFIKRIGKEKVPIAPYLTTTDIQAAENYFWKLSQAESYPLEVASFHRSNLEEKKSV